MSFEIIIQETHLDVFGHVNNAKYLEIYEQSRWYYITEKGYGLEKIKQTQQGPVILEAKIRFLKELKERQKIKISLELVDYEGKVGHLKQQMTNEKNEIVSDLILTFGLFDLKARKLIEPTAEWKNAIGAN